MKDLFIGIAIGAVAGAMISSPKCKRMIGKVKDKLSDRGCDCGCGAGSDYERGAGSDPVQTGMD